MVVLLGPNGAGKSSLLEALNAWRGLNFIGLGKSDRYYSRTEQPDSVALLSSLVTVVPHGKDLRADRDRLARAVYVRTPYRHGAEINLQHLQSADGPWDEGAPRNLSDSDKRLGQNFIRLLNHTIRDLYDPSNGERTAREITTGLVGRVRDSIRRALGSDLHFDDLGNPLQKPRFTFSKGTSQRYDFANLSGGERAAFDLILDMALKADSYTDTVYCIDEPELHLHSRVHGTVLEELLAMLPPDGPPDPADIEGDPTSQSQLWISTHSAGFLNKALDLYKKAPEEVAFLDFDGLDFDHPQTIKPAVVDRKLWRKTFAVALHDLAELILPPTIVLCEGRPIGSDGAADKAAFDAKILNTIFGTTRPDTEFVSSGGKTQVEADMLGVATFASLASGVRIMKVIDRDTKSETERKERLAANVRVLTRCSIENYLWCDEILAALLKKHDLSHVYESIIRKKRDPSEPEDHTQSIKARIRDVHAELRRHRPLQMLGESKEAFAKDALAPLVTPDTDTYRNLESDIFG